MAFKYIVTHHFVKSEDLNHHKTLFAGRTAEWFVESGLMAAAVHLVPENIVCVKIHGMNFTRPIHLGDTVCFTSVAVYAGRTSLISHIVVSVNDVEILSGYMTFCNVDKHGKATPHGVEIVAENEEERLLQETAKALPRK